VPSPSRRDAWSPFQPRPILGTEEETVKP